MLKVLIVEDEILVRLGIKASIDWEKIGMNVIADVGNGQAAWEVYEKQKPDLILTDIKMPLMDGLKLIEKIREKDSRTKIIILSCLDEFGLVRKAMTLGVMDYILKLTMTQDEMEAVLKKAQKELLEDNALKSVVNNANTIAVVSKESLISDYLFYNIYSEDRFAELVSDLKLKINPRQLVLCIMEIDHFEVLQDKFSDEQGRLIRSSILNMVNELLEKYQRGVFIHIKDKNYIIIFSFSDVSEVTKANEILNEILEHIKRVMKTYFDCIVTFGISSIRDSYSSLKSMYQESSDIIEYKYFLGMGKIIVSRKIDLERIKGEVIIRLQHLLNDLNIMNVEYASELNTEFKTLINSFNISKVELKKFFQKLGYRILIPSNLNYEYLSILIMNYTQQITFCETLDESIEAFKAYLSEIANTKMKKGSYSKEIVKTVKFVQNHYNTGITLQQIAEMVELSPNYLCSIFKKELGIGLTDYVTKYRIEKAKEMLVNTSLKSYEIAEKVGFTDESYFSRIFKKATGMRPNEFKKQGLPSGDFMGGI